MKWTKKNMKTDISYKIFTDECRATLDKHDRRDFGRLLQDILQQTRIRCQQDDVGVMFWAGIVDNTLFGPFKAPQGEKHNEKNTPNCLMKP